MPRNALRLPALALLCCAAPAWAALPPLIPRDVLFTAPERGQPMLSPDGRRLAFLGASEGGVPNVFVRDVGGGEVRQVTSDQRRGVAGYAWSPAGNQVLHVQDRDGDENWHLYATDVGTGETRNLTPYPSVRAANLLVDPVHPGEVMVGMNRRDPRIADMYRVRLDSGETTLEAENPGDVIEWVADHDFQLRACAAIDDEGNAIIRVRDTPGGPWRDLKVWPFEAAGFDRFQRVLGFSRDGLRLRVQSCAGTNTTRIVEVDLATGAESDLTPADPDHDLWNHLDLVGEFMPVAALFDPANGALQAYAVHRMIPEWRVLDPAIERDFERIRTFRPGLFEVASRDRDDRRWIVEFTSDTDPGAFYVYDRDSDAFELLFEKRPNLAGYTFAPMKPVRYRARDGLAIHAYLTLPVGVEPRRLPLIVLPHGGPWARDEWGFNVEVQWLANRGYAVLQPQFRGSTGFGNAFVAASTGEIGTGHMQHDLTDGVRWAIAEGIADPRRIAIMGASYGGYATLAGLAFTPELYACGVDVVGPSNLRTLIRSFPPYWKPRMKRWTARVGDVLNDDALNRRVSPLFHVGRVRAPLLIGHGANDPRVKLAESDQVVAALRRNRREVTYVVYPDEGHGFARPANAEDFNGRTEAFLAKHLGGRAEPWRKVEGASAEER
jgi:dipeptidyl aminopeptidase/acylaminoacyl peptidase